MRYQQFASHAYCVAAGPVSKMALQQEKAFCVLNFEVSRSVITVQRNFRALFQKDAPHKNNISSWYQQFVETGCLCKDKSPGRPRVSDDLAEQTSNTKQKCVRLRTLRRASLRSSSSNSISVVNLRTIRWIRNVAHWRKMRCV
jgi:hypothetical protein